jgi:hypothetical protein
MLTVTLCAALMWTASHDVRSRALRAASPPIRLELPGPDRIDRTSPRPALQRDSAIERRDLYGNDVSAAVATYTYDGEGSVHEEHSPQTEVPHLKPPIS